MKNWDFNRFKLGLFALILALALPASALNSVRTAEVSLGASGAQILMEPRNFGSVVFQFSGTWTATITFEATVDETNWVETPGVDIASGTSATTTEDNGMYMVSAVGAYKVRARITAYTSGTVTAIAQASEGVGKLAASSSGGGGGAGSSVDVLSIAAGNNNIGNVDIVTSALPSGASTEATLAAASAKLPATLGQKAMAASMAVVLASDQASVPVAATLQAGTAGIGKLTANSGVDIGDVDVASIAAGNNNIGDVDVASSALPTGAATSANQSTEITALQLIDDVVGTTGSAVPTKANYMGAASSGNLTGLIQADNSVKIDVSTATTTQLVALTSAQKIYVTSWDVIAAGTGTIKLVYGTGSSCGTGTTDLTGAYSLIAQAGIAKGNGLGPVLVVPAGNALCVTTSAGVGMQGSVAYTKF